MQNIIPNSIIQKKNSTNIWRTFFLYYFSMHMYKVGEKEKGRMDA